MPLHIPIGKDRLPHGDMPLTKGQLYNLDNDEWIDFQFNPEFFEWDQAINWKDFTHKGDPSGGDLQFLNIGPRTFDLALIYAADPGAPEIKRDIGLDGGDEMTFERIEEVMENWRQLLPEKKRPSRIKVIIGSRTFDCIVENIRMRITEWFDDLTAREALLTLEFREWLLEA